MGMFPCLIIISLLRIAVTTNSTEKFVATSQWQPVEEGQEIPAGLHVRINLQTGKKEAKLMDEDNESIKKKSLIPQIKEDVIDPDKLKSILKNVKGEKFEETDTKKFRTYEDIKHDFESLNIEIQTDIEMLIGFMEAFERADDPHLKRIILEDLEYLVHQYDNAAEFVKRGGVAKIIIPSLNSTTDDIRTWSLRLIGSAAQSHPQVQKAAIEAGIIDILLRLIARETDATLRGRSLFALSCVMLNFPRGQHIFFDQGGMTVLANVFDDLKHGTGKLQLKIVTLITDMLVERKKGSLRKIDPYEGINLKEILSEQGWCPRISQWFQNLAVSMDEEDGERLDHDAVDKGTDLMLALELTCMDTMVIDGPLIKTVDFFQRVYSDLLLTDRDNGIEDSMYEDMTTKLGTLLQILLNPKKYHEEL